MAVLQRSSTYKAEGVVLSRRDLGDADRIVTLFTREFGRRRLVARGSRRPTSQLAPHIELFTRVRLMGVVGANLDVLTQAQSLETYPRFRSDLAAFAAAGWAVELLDGLSEDGEAAPDAYAALTAFLRALNGAAADPEPLLSALAINLLDMHGYGPRTLALHGLPAGTSTWRPCLRPPHRWRHLFRVFPRPRQPHPERRHLEDPALHRTRWTGGRGPPARRPAHPRGTAHRPPRLRDLGRRARDLVRPPA